jgi:hypothetical protein
MIYGALGGAVAALLLAIAAYFHGVEVGVDKQRSADLAANLKDEKEQRRRLEAGQRDDDSAARAAVARETTVREITREVPKIIDRTVYRNVCIDADGVRLIRRGVEAANGEQPPGRRPAGDPGEIRDTTGND